MPLSEPKGSDFSPFDVRRFLMHVPISESGADAVVAFNSIVWDAVNERMILGGDNSYVGFLADLQTYKMQQAAALPSSVIPASTISFISHDAVQDIIYAKGGVTLANVARSGDGGATWVNISAGLRVFNYGKIMPWRNVLLAHAMNSATDLDISPDNGATWTGTAASGAPGAGGVFGYWMTTNPAQSKLVITGSLGIAWTDDDNVALPWNTFDFNAMFPAFVGINGYTCGALSDDGQKFVIAPTSQDIIMSTDGLLTWQILPRNRNPFINVATGLGTPLQCAYSAFYGGFIFSGTTATASRVMFIPEDMDIATELPIIGTNLGSVLPGTAALNARNQSASNGTIVMFPGGATNDALISTINSP